MDQTKLSRDAPVPHSPVVSGESSNQTLVLLQAREDHQRPRRRLDFPLPPTLTSNPLLLRCHWRPGGELGLLLPSGNNEAAFSSPTPPRVVSEEAS